MSQGNNQSQKNVLGTGLSALLGQNVINTSHGSNPTYNTAASGGPQIAQLGLNQISPNKSQPRINFSADELNELSESIKQKGVLQPILVKHSGKDIYEIISGERRYRASVLAGKASIPAIIMQASQTESIEITLIENIQRENLTPIEEASGYVYLTNNSYTHESIAKIVGKSRSYITNLLRLLELPDDIKASLERKEISVGHAKVLLGVENPQVWASLIIKYGISVRQLEKFINNGLNEDEVRTATEGEALYDSVSEDDNEFDVDSGVQDFTLAQYLNEEDESRAQYNAAKSYYKNIALFLRNRIQMPVRCTPSKKDKNAGKITIKYTNIEELKNFISLFSGKT